MDITFNPNYPSSNTDIKTDVDADLVLDGSQATAASVTALSNKLGTPSKTDFGTTLGTPAGASVSADVASAAAAIAALFAQTTDASNSHTGALGGSATFAGATSLWGNHTSIEIVGSNDHTGTLQVRQRVASVWITEQWTVPITAAGSEWTVAAARLAGADAYNVQFVNDATAQTALVITTSATVNPVDSQAAFKIDGPTNILAAGNHIFARPVGSRAFYVSGWEVGTAALDNTVVVYQRDSGTNTVDMQGEGFSPGRGQRTYLHPTAVDVYVSNGMGGTVAISIFWCR